MLRLNDQERQLLLGIAREAVRAELNGEAVEPVDAPSTALHVRKGAFVSIHCQGRLRGCMGRIQSDNPLYRTTAECAVSAATCDPRFSPLKLHELQETAFEVTVLGDLNRVTDINSIRIPGHGLFVEMGRKRGLLLPQVAAEHGWDRSEFLSQTCIKAGLVPHAWGLGADVFAFEALVIGE